MFSIRHPIKPRLLIIDDDRISNLHVSSIGQHVGFSTRSIHEPKKISLSAILKADVIVLDLIMPDVDGLTVIDMVSTQESKPTLILLSGAEQKHINAVAAYAKAKDVFVIGALHKPVTSVELRPILMRAKADAYYKNKAFQQNTTEK